VKNLNLIVFVNGIAAAGLRALPPISPLEISISLYFLSHEGSFSK
jgi:hypothetical protein